MTTNEQMSPVSSSESLPESLSGVPSGVPSGESSVSASMRGVILFGHGARDARWAEPFERLAGRVAALSALSQTSVTTDASGPITLAYLEMMTPDLATAVAEQVTAGCTIITIVPIFFGTGAHLRRDFPVLMDACRATHPSVTITSAPPVGEDDGVLDAIGNYVLKVW